MKGNEKQGAVTASSGKIVRGFILKTLFYFLVIMGLIYLYEYCGIGAAGFIYNEF
ncbi:MAG: teichoic acid D-Ala incorporation-associated protein DltX [Lacticaseibacillus absianus]